MRTIVVLEKVTNKPSFYGLCGLKIEREIVVIKRFYCSVAYYSHTLIGNKLNGEASVNCVSDPFKELGASSFIEKTVNGLIGIGFKVKYRLRD